MRGKIPVWIALVLIAGIAAPLRAQDKPSRFEPAEVVSTVETVYPPNAVNPGTVVLDVTVSPSGEVESVKVVRDAPGFTSEAQRVIQKWKFRPAKLDGQPIRSVVAVAFSFGQPLIWKPGPSK